jgi:hypothetical protein
VPCLVGGGTRGGTAFTSPVVMVVVGARSLRMQTASLSHGFDSSAKLLNERHYSNIKNILFIGQCIEPTKRTEKALPDYASCMKSAILAPQWGARARLLASRKKSIS